MLGASSSMSLVLINIIKSQGKISTTMRGKKYQSVVITEKSVLDRAPMPFFIFNWKPPGKESPFHLFIFINYFLNYLIYLIALGLSLSPWDLCRIMQDFVVAHRLSSCGIRALLPCGTWDLSSMTRQAPVTCIAGQILNHWTTREVPQPCQILGKNPNVLISYPAISTDLWFWEIRGFAFW